MLGSGYYKIPRFQRPYAWDRENIQEFWDDIVRDEPENYFIGSMVVYNDGAQKFGVVDGQQRLTTITILLCALRNLLASRGHTNLATGIHTLIERPNIDNQPEFVVSTETSYPFFQDRIQKWGEPSLTLHPLAEELNLQAAFDQLSTLLAQTAESIELDPSLSPKKKAEKLQQKMVSIRDALLNLSLIFVQLDDEDDAYVIFETLNTRGKDLSLTDLVKNHLTKHIRSRNPQTDEVKFKWTQFLETIEESSAPLETDKFLHHFWLSKYDYLPVKTLFKTLKKKVTAAGAKAFLNEVVADAKLYRSIHEVGYGGWSKQEARIARALDALNLFRVVQPIPCVLSLLREYKATKKVQKRHVEDALVAIENFHFSFTAVTSQRSSGGISQMYALHARQLFEAKDSQQCVRVIRDLKQKLKRRVPSFEEFSVLFRDILVTDNLTKQRNLVRYILSELLRNTSSAPTDYSQLTIEHVASQSEISKDLPANVVGQIGNLLLVPEELNNKLRNKAFSDKKRILKDSGFKLPSEIEDADSWTGVEIASRTASLARLSYEKVWKV